MDAKDKEREVEPWLDTALTQYAKAEPRAGLENRVLANLRVEKDRLATHRRWRWTVGAVAVAAVVVAAVWTGVRDTRRAPNRAVSPAAIRNEDAATTTQTVPQTPVMEHTQAVVRNPRRVTSVVARHAKEPKLDQFPSPLPLTDQERVLMQYVREFPNQAVLVARAQTQLRKQEEREMLPPGSEAAAPTTSDQPE